MKLLLTGATGFIGRHVLTRLAGRADVELTLLSRQPVASVRTVIGSIEDDRLDWAALGSPDTVLDLAWGGLPNYRSPHHFEELHRHSLFLRRLAHAGVSRIVCAGTCYEYGMQQGCLTEDLPTDPANAYGLAKDSLRRQLELDRSDAALTWARFFYLYGEGQAPTSLYSQVQGAIARRDPEFRMSGGEQLRDFLPIGAAADHLVMLALGRELSGIYNICSGEPVSVRRLVETWFAEGGHMPKLVLGHYPYPDWEPFAFWGSAAKLAAARRAA